MFRREWGRIAVVLGFGAAFIATVFAIGSSYEGLANALFVPATIAISVCGGVVIGNYSALWVPAAIALFMAVFAIATGGGGSGEGSGTSLIAIAFIFMLAAVGVIPGIWIHKAMRRRKS